MSSHDEIDIRKNVDHIQQQIEETCYQVGRDPDEIQLIVVTKEKSAVVIKNLVDAGISKIGESYVQEASFKMELLSDLDIEWHMVGHIQSGKVNYVAGHFSYVHSLDRLALASDLNKAAKEWNRVLPVLLECNVSGEESKFGWRAWNENNWQEVAKEMEPVLEMEHLDVQGLMTMAPYHEDPEHSRPYFKRLARLRGFLAEQLSTSTLQELSMGMSADFRVAIEEGATMVRIGSAIVGARSQ